MKPDERIFEYSLNLANAENLSQYLVVDDWVADVKELRIWFRYCFL